VLETLKKHDPKRRCFRSIGGVLVERTVADVIPAVEYNAEQVSNMAPHRDHFIYIKYTRPSLLTRGVQDE